MPVMADTRPTKFVTRSEFLSLTGLESSLRLDSRVVKSRSRGPWRAFYDIQSSFAFFRTRQPERHGNRTVSDKSRLLQKVRRARRCIVCKQPGILRDWNSLRRRLCADSDFGAEIEVAAAVCENCVRRIFTFRDFVVDCFEDVLSSFW